MKKRVCIVTTTRADYGILKPLILKLSQSHNYFVELIATGTHLSHSYGYTLNEIESDGMNVSTIDNLVEEDNQVLVNETMANTLAQFGNYFAKEKPDLLILLGDRYEVLSIAIAAYNEHISIAHLHGGELTEGALDDNYRHAITKLAQLHFTSTEEYRNRVIQLGEHPDRVFAVGALGIDNILHVPLWSKEELLSRLNVPTNLSFAMVTFHPVTSSQESSTAQMKCLLDALSLRNNRSYLITYANADKGGNLINELIEDYVATHSNCYAFTSLGMIRYLTGLKYCDFVIGNSSSGIIEAPSFGVPTINIGDRQNGRIQATSIYNCEVNTDCIVSAIDEVMTPPFLKRAKQTINPYGTGNAAISIVNILDQYPKFISQKSFYDL